MAELKLYVDRHSQPARAIIIFCKANDIDFEEVPISIAKGEHRTADYAEINPMKQVPAIIHEDLKLNESHAILVYIATAFPGVADHWYPADLRKRAKIHSVLDWHHSNLRRGTVGYVYNLVLAPAFNLPKNIQAAAEGEKILIPALTTIETVWLQENGKFLLGNDQPSIADLSLVCEIMQLQVLDDNDRNRFLGPHKKVQQWMDDVKNATNPYFEEVHQTLFETASSFTISSASKEYTTRDFML